MPVKSRILIVTRKAIIQIFVTNEKTNISLGNFRAGDEW